jgi:hypothetical protein
MKQATSRKWENCRVDARNILQQLLAYSERETPEKAEQLRRWERRQQWGPFADELQPIIRSFVDTMVAKAPVPANVAEKVKRELSWDIFFICLEEEYRDLVEPPFYQPQLDQWYAKGHFPCGWDGEPFPERWPENEIPYLDAKRIRELWGEVVHQGRLIVF